MSFDTTVNYSSLAPLAGEPTLHWSDWANCETDLLTMPNEPGVFALAEEMKALQGTQRTLAVFGVASVEDLGRALASIYHTPSPVRDRLLKSRCFVRYTLIPNDSERANVAAALQHWLTRNEA